jgi:hypothetical protein
VELVWLLLLFGFELVVLELVEQELGDERRKEERWERRQAGSQVDRGR